MEIVVTLISSGMIAGIVSGIFSLIMYKIQRKDAKADKKEDKETGIQSGVRIILYDRIKFLGKKYLSNKEISAEELEDLLVMHKIYHNDLGGNGFLDNLMKQVESLPIKEK